MHDGHGFNPLEPQSKIHRVLSSAVGSLRSDVTAARTRSSSSVHPRVLCGKVKDHRGAALAESDERCEATRWD